MLRGFEKAVHAELYAKYRPTYPSEVAAKVIEYALGNKTNGKLTHMVDVGCGSGQSTEMYKSAVEKITAIDISASQIDEAKKAGHGENIQYLVGTAEAIPVADKSVDLLCSAQAIHWADFPAFWEECRRVMKQDGSMALYGYDMPHIVPANLNGCTKSVSELKESVRKLLLDLHNSCKFHKRIDHVNNKYVEIFDLIPCADKRRDDSLQIKRDWTVCDVGKYLSTWSGYQTYLRERKPDDKSLDILRNFLNKLKILCGQENSNDADINVVITWDIFIIFSKRPE